MARNGPGRSGPCRGRRRRPTPYSIVYLRGNADPRGRDHELARAIARANGGGPATRPLGASPRDEVVEFVVARLEVRARIVDQAGERRDGGYVRRPDEARRVRRAH